MMQNLNHLVSIMNGVPSTNQWDIVCSYTVTQLNQFLQTQYDADKIAKKVSLSTERQEPVMGTDFTISYDIQFASPQLGFINGRSGFATLTMLIKDGSSYSITPKGATQPTRTVSIPGGKYSVKAVVPLAAIKGDTGEIKEQGDIIEFSDSNSHDNHVIIHFKNEKGTLYEIVPEPDPQDKDTLVTYFLPVLKQYFQTEIKEIDYALSTVNNNKPSNELTIFTPKSFVFASMGDADTGVLSLYIQTAESNNSPGNASPSFQPRDNEVFPIPESYTASIILSYDLITKAFLKPQLEKCGFNVSFNTASEGITAQITKDIAVVVPGEDNATIGASSKYGGFNVNFKDYPLTLNLRQGELTLFWKLTVTSEWQEYSGGMYSTPIFGSVDITMSLAFGQLIKFSNDSVNLISLTVNQSELDIKVEKSPSYANDPHRIPDYYNKLVTNPFSFGLNLHGFNYFTTTNLLAPGEHMIEVCANRPISTPHDFLIVGQVVKK